MRACGVTSMYLPKNAIGCSESGWPNTKRYVPPVRTSISQESMVKPNDFGAHHRLNSSGLVQASNTTRAGALKVRVTTSSRSDFRSTVVGLLIGADSPSLFAFIDLLFSFHFLDNLVQLVEACLPKQCTARRYWRTTPAPSTTRWRSSGSLSLSGSGISIHPKRSTRCGSSTTRCARFGAWAPRNVGSGFLHLRLGQCGLSWITWIEPPDSWPARTWVPGPISSRAQTSISRSSKLASSRRRAVGSRELGAQPCTRDSHV